MVDSHSAFKIKFILQKILPWFERVIFIFWHDDFDPKVCGWIPSQRIRFPTSPPLLPPPNPPETPLLVVKGPSRVVGGYSDEGGGNKKGHKNILLSFKHRIIER